MWQEWQLGKKIDLMFFLVWKIFLFWQDLGVLAEKWDDFGGGWTHENQVTDQLRIR